MRKVGTAATLTWGALLLAACEGATGPDDDDPLPEPLGSPRLELVAQGLSQPLMLTAPPGDARLFVAEQTGAIRILTDGSVTGTMLDLGSQVSAGGEQGLLGLAFHPSFAANGRVFVSYTDPAGDTRVMEYEADPASGVAAPGSARVILSVDQPFSNHNGGHLEFGPDGRLFIGLGDGGGAGDPMAHGQNLGTVFGTILRLDVGSTTEPYRIPDDNPFVDVEGARPEIWAYGLRNPWRFAIDAGSGLMVIGDVGQNAWEEIDLAPLSDPGRNFGWRIMEGLDCYVGPGCGNEALIRPAYVYGHADACSVTGGHIYRGALAPALVGRVLFADYCAGWVRSAAIMNAELTDITEFGGARPGSVTSFGRDGRGESYVLTRQGGIYLVTQ